MNIKVKRNIKKLAFQLIDKGRISTSVPLAKEVRKKVEKMITYSKKDTVSSRRYVSRNLPRKAVDKLFGSIGPANKEREGGYTRILRVGPRKGDGSERCILEIINV
ncbi:MAG: 50S ribosomal protein L17 [Elusimicrobia bacterium]|nr:50S ribosomal protein L17 [Elusimicrobiota bacterium]